MAKPKTLVLYGGAYATIDDALADLHHLNELHREGHIGKYDAVAMTKEPNGYVQVANTDATERGSGAWKGALAGAVLGAIFPPAIIVGAAAGAVAGAAAGDLSKRLGSDEAKQLADLLQPGESGVIFVGESIEDAYASAVLQHATRQRALVIDADEDIVEAALQAAQG